MLKNLRKQRGAADNTHVCSFIFVVRVVSPEGTKVYKGKFNYLHVLMQTY